MSDPNSYGVNSGMQPEGVSPWAGQSYPEPVAAQPYAQQPAQPYPQYRSDQSAPNPAGRSFPQYSAEQQQAGYQPWAAQPAPQPYGQVPVGQPGTASYAPAGFSPYAGQPPAERKWSGLAIAGFIVGLLVLGISLFSGVVVMAVLPIALCARALVDVKRNNKKGKALAIIGMVLAGISAILYIVNIIAG